MHTDFVRNDTAVYVTRPFLPSLEEFLPYLEAIWKNKQLTNSGPFLAQFENELAAFLGVRNVIALTNATVALILALKALDIKGEVITTPYSFVATTHSIWWNGLTPVFADINPRTGNIDPASIRKLITPQTSAIMPVHVYGNACEVEEIDAIGREYNLKVIYDAAHAFGVTHKDKSVLSYGDMSVLSFHATKSFTTFEGGAIICSTPELRERVYLLQNFGIADETTVIGSGLNGKMDEFKAALGILQLKHYQESLQLRKIAADSYNRKLHEVSGLVLMPSSKQNFSYYPVKFEGEAGKERRDKVYTALKQIGVHSRKYFYPCISNYPVYRSLPTANPIMLPEANHLADRILCLPIYAGLQEEVIDCICNCLIETLQESD